MDRSVARTALLRLGAGEPIEAVCEKAGISRAEFDGWWRQELAARLPRLSGAVAAPVAAGVEIARDRWGVPHVFAPSDQDLFFGYGFAMAQDRLWQMDYLRRKAKGRLAEVMGPQAIEQDMIARTVGLPQIASDETKRLPQETAALLEAFSAGVNAQIEACEAHPPIEFDLLDYRPEPWSPVDSIAVLAELRWYLTGRLYVIALPELAKRTLESDALYRAFLTPEAWDETILPPGSYPQSRQGEEVIGGGSEGNAGGSNNWAVAGRRSASGAPMLASDPHIAFGALSCWYEAHLAGGSFNVAGAGYVGVPGLWFGRNEGVAWGITNNICSQRDLYQERTDPAHPGCFLYDGQWEPAKRRVEEMRVKGGETVRKEVLSSRNGPIVDEILPPPCRATGPVSLRWVGSGPSDETTALLAANRARTGAAFRAALRGWRVPTLNFVFADAEGHIGYQAAGRVPVREAWDRGYRRGWEPADAWRAYIPFEGMPALADPPQGYVRTANNPNAPRDYPYPLSGAWAAGYRAKRIRAMLEAQPQSSRVDFRRMHLDVLSLRAAAAVPGAVWTLDTGKLAGAEAEAVALLKGWDFRMETASVAASIFEAFFRRWCRTVAAARFPQDAVAAVTPAVAGLAVALASGDEAGWFKGKDRRGAMARALAEALDDLRARLGDDMSRWTWGRLHTFTNRHFLSGRGDLGTLLDRGDAPVGGTDVTVCNTGGRPDFKPVMGANYRLVVDIAEGGAWALSASGESGCPGSANYCDQLEDWIAGRYHYLPLSRAEAVKGAVARQMLSPKKDR